MASAHLAECGPRVGRKRTSRGVACLPHSPLLTGQDRGKRLAPSAGMCGFVGGILRRPVVDEDIRHFRRGADTLAHRGPDDRMVTAIREAHAVLAFRRLSIIDLAS